MQKKTLLLAACLLLIQSLIHAQTTETPPQRIVQSYLSFIFPLATLQGGTVTPNFENSTVVGFPVGINVIYSERFGFSYEFTPSITIHQPSGKSTTSKMTNLLFDPGPMFRFSHGFTIITRLAFETSGRYGFTPVFNQVVFRSKTVNYFIAGSLPVRFGNDAAASLGVNLQIGFVFR